MIKLYHIAWKLFLIILLARGLPLPAGAHELEGDRPDVTESALTVPRHSLQVEAGYTVGEYGTTVEQSVGEVLVRYGLLGFIELRLGLNSYVITDDDAEGRAAGKDDLSIGVKLQLLRNASFSSAWIPNSALILGLTVPSGSAHYRGEGPEPRATLCVAWELPGDFHFGTNFTLLSPVTDGVRSRVFSASFALGYSLTDRIGMYIEHYLDNPEDGEALHFADAGLTFGLTPDLQFDIRGGTGLDGTDAWFAGAGFIARFLDLI